MDLGIEGELAVVTGGASGIGRATVELLAAEGARVVVLDRVKPEERLPSGIERVRADITSGDELAAAAEDIEQRGPVSILVHCAAIGSGRFGFPFTNLSPAEWNRVLEVNILGTVNVAHTFAPAMRDRGRGSIVLLASVAGQIGSQTDPPYSASKAANINFAQCMAKDLAPHGVRVNTVCPAMVQTPLNRSVWEAWNAQQPASGRRTYEDWAGEKVRNVIPLQRWQTPADVANLIVFLSSPRAAAMTGQTINVDGGFVMHW